MFKSRKYKVNFKHKQEIEPNEIILDALSKKKEEELGLSEKKLIAPLLKQKLVGVFFFSFLLFLLLFLRTFQLAALNYEKYSDLAEENKYISHQIQAKRGVIYDKNLNQLVFNQSSFDLICQEEKLPKTAIERKLVFKNISTILKKDISQCQPVVAENLSHQTLIILETKQKELPGFEIVNNTVRKYREPADCAHILGYTGKVKNDEQGKDGLEKRWEETLRKIPGEVKITRDALGNIISKEIISLPQSGQSLILSLDSDLQKKIKSALFKQLKNLDTRKAAVVALDPRDGAVLSLVSLPDFDNNLLIQGTSQELTALFKDKDEPFFNRAIAGQYAIGSTIKPLIASAALEEKIISPQKQINCQGVIKIKNKLWPDAEPEFWEYHDWSTHFWTDIRKAIAESCNIFFYTLGGGYENFKGLGNRKIKEYLELFGWGKETGIDLPGEEDGFLPSPEWKEDYFSDPKEKIWGVGNTYLLSIGQQFISATPLQVAVSFSAIANNGTLYQPYLVKKIIQGSSNSPQVIEEIKPKIIRENFISSENLNIVRQGMRQAVSGENSPQASAVELNSLPVKVAAKTGTAQTGNGYHNWVTVFAPYENPEIVLTVMVEDVKEIERVVLPIAREVLNWYFR